MGKRKPSKSRPVRSGKQAGDMVSHDGRQIILTAEQQSLLDKIVKDKQSLFFTGSAGTGKSILLKETIRRLRANGRRVAVTASTGIAALNIGGTTLHAFSGVGLGKLPDDKLMARVTRSRVALRRWRETEVLVIDEISMVDGSFLDLVDRVARGLRRNTKPFGGIQLVVSGDFFQLPPVSDRDEFGGKQNCTFAFEAECWGDVFPHAYKLTQVFRQTDKKLIDLLNEMRVGAVSEKSTRLLSKLSRQLSCNDGIQPTEIFPLRREVEKANNMQILRLRSAGFAYSAVDRYGTDTFGNPVLPAQGEVILEQMIPKTLGLRVGAQVMCVNNIPDSNLVNGSRGCIVDFMTPQEAWEQGFPIAGSAAETTEDSSQGPLVRVKQMFRGSKWPLVHFISSGKYLVTPIDFRHENDIGRLKAARRQVPLVLAWAMTIHKAQGQTIDRLKVDLGNTFADGQAYVAVSRCRSLGELQVVNFSPSSIFVNQKVIEWDRNLSVAPMTNGIRK